MQALLTKAYTLLSDSHRRRIVPIVLLLALGSLLDFFSLASFLPVIFLIINPGQTTPWLAKLYSLTGFDNPVPVAVSLTVAALVLILIKTQIQIWITNRKASYAYSAAADLASRTLTNYFKFSYIQFTQIDYAREINRIANLPLIFANNIVIPFGTILSEALVASLLLICLAFFDYKVFLFLFALLVPVLLLYRTRRKKIKAISEQLKTAIPLLLKQTLQAVEGLLEIRLHRKEDFFKERFNRTFQQLEKTIATDHTNNMSALRTTELIAALCVGVLLLYALLSRQSFPNTMLLLTVYAGASFRIVPSINRMFVSILQIRTNEYALQELEHSLVHRHDHFETVKESLPFKHSIELRNIHFAYADRPPIFKGANLTIHKNEKVLLAGKSGVGKTSLLLILLRFITEQTGEIHIDNKKLDPENTAKWQKLFGYVSQNPTILDASIAENIAFGIHPAQIDHDRVNKLVIALDLHAWVNSLPNKLNTIMGEKGVQISGGQRQRLAIARTLYHGAEILLLDEITNHLDKQTRREVMQTLSANILENKTIIMVSHATEENDFFDSAYDLQDGQFLKLFQKVKVHS